MFQNLVELYDYKTCLIRTNSKEADRGLSGTRDQTRGYLTGKMYWVAEAGRLECGSKSQTLLKEGDFAQGRMNVIIHKFKNLTLNQKLDTESTVMATIFDWENVLGVVLEG
jgi:hypothetical protein